MLLSEGYISVASAGDDFESSTQKFLDADLPGVYRGIYEKIAKDVGIVIVNNRSC